MSKKFPNKNGGKRDTALILAAEKGHKDCVKSLINVGVDITCSNSWNGYTALHYASQNGWLDIAQSLLEKGADFQVEGKGGITPLILAAQYGRKEVVKLLIDAGAAINCKEGYTEMHYASENGWLEIVQFILKKGADIEVKSETDRCPLFLAAFFQYPDIVELLINAGANVNCSGGSSNYTVLHMASNNGWLEIVKSLLKKGAKIEAKTSRGHTSLQLAFLYGKIEIAEHLISAGADVNVGKNGGRSTLSYVIGKSPNIKLVRLLIKRGAYLNCVDYETVSRNSSLTEHILQDIKLCSQAIINKFNYKDLPELYKLSVDCEILPRIENMRIEDVESNTQSSASQVTHEVLKCVEDEIRVKGHCNVLEVSPKVLKMLTVQSFLKYCENIKKLYRASNQMKRSAEYGYGNRYAKTSSKMMRFN